MSPRLITRRGLLASGERPGPTEPTGETVGSNPFCRFGRFASERHRHSLAPHPKIPGNTRVSGDFVLYFPFVGPFHGPYQNSGRNRSRFLLPIAEKRQGAFSYCRKFYPNRPLSKFYFKNDWLLAHKSALYVKPRLVPAPYRPFIASQYGDVPDDPMEVRLFRGVLHG